MTRTLPASELASIGAGMVALAITLYNLIQFYQPNKNLVHLVLIVVFGVVAVSFLYTGLRPSAIHAYRVMKDQHGSTLWFKLLRLCLIAVIGVTTFVLEVALSLLFKGGRSNTSSRSNPTHVMTVASTAVPNPYVNPDWNNPEELEAYLNGEEMPASAYAPKHYK